MEILKYYSALSASMGLTLAAFRAGISPAIVPAIIITIVALSLIHISEPTRPY